MARQASSCEESIIPALLTFHKAKRCDHGCSVKVLSGMIPTAGGVWRQRNPSLRCVLAFLLCHFELISHSVS